MLSGIAHDPIQRDIFTPLFFGASLFVPEPADVTTPGRFYFFFLSFFLFSLLFLFLSFTSPPFSFTSSPFSFTSSPFLKK